MENKISKFDGEYSFLSNFYECPIDFLGLHFNSSEAAFQSMKTPIHSEQLLFINLSPSAAKKLGRKIQLRQDWELVKDHYMYRIVLAKFTQNYNLKQKLILTGEAELIEGNYWNDTYWGVCNGIGQNKLGKILMRVRSELRE